MAETTADVRRDIEITRERLSGTLAQLERKMNLSQIVKDNPWPAIGVAVGAGLLLSGSRADVKAAAATAVATRGASSRLGTALDDIVARLMSDVTEAFHGHVDNLLGQVKDALGAPAQGNGAAGSRGFADVGGSGVGASGSRASTGDRNPWSTPQQDVGAAGAFDSRSTSTPSAAGSQAMG